MTTEPKSPSQLASAAADAVRALNHATLSAPRDGWQYPGNAYSTVASLSEAAMMLPQAYSQLDALIRGLQDEDHLASDKGPEDLPERLREFHQAMLDAQRQAHALYRSLNEAHQLLGPVAYKE